MGQKVNPIGLRLGYIRGWDSNWFESSKSFSTKLVEDEKIRRYLEARVAKGGISRIVIERTLKKITITICTARPGMIIGKSGVEIERIKEELKKITKKEIQVNIIEVKRPELDAKLVGQSIAQQLKARISYRRVMQHAIDAAMRAGAQGIKIKIAGRLGGAEIARSEQNHSGRVPLQKLRANIDYASVAANTIYGTLGVKIWVFKHEVYERPDLSPSAMLLSKKETNAATNGFASRAKQRDEKRRKLRETKRK